MKRLSNNMLMVIQGYSAFLKSNRKMVKHLQICVLLCTLLAFHEIKISKTLWHLHEKSYILMME